MAATHEQIARLRRMIDEPTPTTYEDVDLAGYIETYPCIDEHGEKPFWLSLITEPPTPEPNDNWIPTYDLAAAAADLWAEKAGVLSRNFDFNADGASYTRSQAYSQAMQQSRYYAARRKPASAQVHVWPQPLPEGAGRRNRDWVGNLPEDDQR